MFFAGENARNHFHSFAATHWPVQYTSRQQHICETERARQFGKVTTGPDINNPLHPATFSMTALAAPGGGAHRLSRADAQRARRRHGHSCWKISYLGGGTQGLCTVRRRHWILHMWPGRICQADSPACSVPSGHRHRAVEVKICRLLCCRRSAYRAVTTSARELECRS